MDRILAFTLIALGAAPAGTPEDRSFPECKRVTEADLLRLPPAEFTTLGLPQIAADTEIAQKMTIATRGYVECMEALGGDYARSLGEERHVPLRNPDGAFPRPDSDPCLDRVIDVMTRMMKDDPEITYLQISHPANLIVRRFESRGEVCWTRFATVVLRRDEPDESRYWPCVDSDTQLTSYRKVAGFRIAFDIRRIDGHDDVGLEEGTWECPDSGTYHEFIGGVEGGIPGCR